MSDHAWRNSCRRCGAVAGERNMLPIPGSKNPQRRLCRPCHKVIRRATFKDRQLDLFGSHG